MSSTASYNFSGFPVKRRLHNERDHRRNVFDTRIPSLRSQVRGRSGLSYQCSQPMTLTLALSFVPSLRQYAWITAVQIREDDAQRGRKERCFILYRVRGKVWRERAGLWATP